MKSFQLAGGAGRIGGLLLILLGAVALATPKASAQTAPTLTTIYSFNGGDGALPYAGLITDASGNLYGTTYLGGTYSSGTVFEVTPSGSETVLYSFSGGDGAGPEAGLIADGAGNLYGTTVGGGSGYGTVFKLTPPQSGTTWTETVIYSFSGGSDGVNPAAGLILDPSGNLYGTTYLGGSSTNGTVFKLTPPQSGTTWTETVIHSFTGGSDGANPAAGLIADGSGNLYGTTIGGGSGYGTVFKLTPPQSGTTWTETVIHSFSGGSDGAIPIAGLILDASGNLYGTTANGGADDAGTVFKLTPTGTETVLYPFTGGSDGAYPQAGLIADGSGNLYGTTNSGGESGNGTVFQLTPTGAETVLYSFTGSGDGANPTAGLVADGSGNLYGTTNSGAGTYGTVFKLTLPAQFNGVPGQPNCTGQSNSFLASKYGGLAHAAASLGYSSVSALQSHLASYCGGM